MRLTVESIRDYLSAGETPEEIIRQHPMLEPEDISACLALHERRPQGGAKRSASAILDPCGMAQSA